MKIQSPKIASAFVPLLFSMLFINVKAQNVKLPEDFKNTLEFAEMTFTMPEGMKAEKVKTNGDLFYNYAVKYRNTDFEVRYSIWPLKDYLKEYEESKGKPDVQVLDPNVLHPLQTIANIMNLSGIMMPDDVPEAMPFDAEAVKREFNADFGSTVFFDLNSEFGKGYKHCLMICLHKDNVADAYVLFLSNSKDEFDKLMMPAFHSLRFK